MGRHPACPSLLFFIRKRKSSKLEASFLSSGTSPFLLWNGRNVTFVINSQIFIEGVRMGVELGETRLKKAA